jgi:hypothetical protein
MFRLMKYQDLSAMKSAGFYCTVCINVQCIRRIIVRVQAEDNVLVLNVFTCTGGERIFKSLTLYTVLGCTWKIGRFWANNKKFANVALCCTWKIYWIPCGLRYPPLITVGGDRQLSLSTSAGVCRQILYKPGRI